MIGKRINVDLTKGCPSNSLIYNYALRGYVNSYWANSNNWSSRGLESKFSANYKSLFILCSHVLDAFRVDLVYGCVHKIFFSI